MSELNRLPRLPPEEVPPMTEQEWLSASKLTPMFQQMHRGQAYPRKLRLFGCACCRRIWPLITDPASRSAVEAAEGFADGRVSRIELDAIFEVANHLGRMDNNHAATAAPADKPLVR